MRQPVDRVRPHPNLKGLRVCARAVSLLPLASGKQGGIHHRDGGPDPTELELTAQPASSPPDGMRATQPLSSLPAGYGRGKVCLSTGTNTPSGEWPSVGSITTAHFVVG